MANYSEKDIIFLSISSNIDILFPEPSSSIKLKEGLIGVTDDIFSSPGIKSKPVEQTAKTFPDLSNTGPPLVPLLISMEV